jgi:hypothetical protein
VTGELDRLKLTRDEEDAGKNQLEKMLVARPLGDEASMGLVVSQFLSWAQNRILTGLGSSVRDFKNIGWFSWLWKLVVVIALAYFLHDKLPYLYNVVWLVPATVKGWLPGMVPEAIAAVIVVLIWGFLAIYVLFGLISLIGLLVLLAAGLAIGPDAMFWNHFASTTAESSPPGPARVYLQSPPPATGSPGLVHSGIYTDPKVTDEIVEWIKSREATLARQQET